MMTRKDNQKADKPVTEAFEEQLRDVIGLYELFVHEGESRANYDGVYETPIIEIQTRCMATIERVAGRHSVYFERATEISKMEGDLYYHLAAQIGVVYALLRDIEKGHLKSLEETIRGDLLADYLEMAAHLEETGYKDPAAVLAGGTLEAHLRKLCDKHGIEVASDDKPKKADRLNAELTKARVYNKLDQKNVTAWLDLRNKAAHAKYDDYTSEQVKILIDSVREFISRYPA